MAKTRANTGNGAIFFVGDSASPTGYTPLLEMKDLGYDALSVPVIDATHLLSPNNTSEKIPGMIMPGQVNLMGNFVGDASQLNISVLAQAQTVFPWKITAPLRPLIDGGAARTYTASGNGFFAKYTPGTFGAGKLNEVKATLEITGAILEVVV